MATEVFNLNCKFTLCRVHNTRFKHDQRRMYTQSCRTETLRSETVNAKDGVGNGDGGDPFLVAAKHNLPIPQLS